MAVPILKQGSVLIASIQTALTDTDVLQLRDDVMRQVTRHRSRGIIVDVTALDVMDSFVSRSLRGIRANRAKVVVIDITGVPTIDSTVANHLVQTVEASRLMGASVIITGLSSDIAQTLVTLGVDLSKVNAVGDLQGGIEEAERLLGYEVSRGEYLPSEVR